MRQQESSANQTVLPVANQPVQYLHTSPATALSVDALHRATIAGTRTPPRMEVHTCAHAHTPVHTTHIPGPAADAPLLPLAAPSCHTHGFSFSSAPPPPTPPDTDTLMTTPTWSSACGCAAVPVGGALLPRKRLALQQCCCLEAEAAGCLQQVDHGTLHGIAGRPGLLGGAVALQLQGGGRMGAVGGRAAGGGM